MLQGWLGITLLWCHCQIKVSLNSSEDASEFMHQASLIWLLTYVLKCNCYCNCFCTQMTRAGQARPSCSLFPWNRSDVCFKSKQACLGGWKRGRRAKNWSAKHGVLEKREFTIIQLFTKVLTAASCLHIQRGETLSDFKQCCVLWSFWTTLCLFCKLLFHCTRNKTTQSFPDTFFVLLIARVWCNLQLCF